MSLKIANLVPTISFFSEKFTFVQTKFTQYVQNPDYPTRGSPNISLSKILKFITKLQKLLITKIRHDLQNKFSRKIIPDSFWQTPLVDGCSLLIDADLLIVCGGVTKGEGSLHKYFLFIISMSTWANNTINAEKYQSLKTNSNLLSISEIGLLSRKVLTGLFVGSCNVFLVFCDCLYFDKLKNNPNIDFNCPFFTSEKFRYLSIQVSKNKIIK